MVDFTRWTTAQLKAALHLDRDGRMQAELDRRTAAGTADDGSEARVEALLRSARKSPRRRSR